MKYYINDEPATEAEFKERLEEAIRYEVEAHYDDMLDDCYPEVHIGCYTFYASQILSKCDPIAYELGKDDFVNSRLEDALADFSVADADWFAGDDFRTEEDDDEDAE